jgi:hypothetical protein
MLEVMNGCRHRPPARSDPARKRSRSLCRCEAVLPLNCYGVGRPHSMVYHWQPKIQDTLRYLEHWERRKGVTVGVGLQGYLHPIAEV